MSFGEQEKNYITPAGLKRLSDELKQLKYRDRPEVTKIVEWAAGNGDRSENGDYIYGKKRLREIDSRLRFLNQRIKLAEVIDPGAVVASDIRFGATVTILDEEDRTIVYTIVGVDEVEVERGRISWRSPVGKALLTAKEGDIVEVRSPGGSRSIEILKVVYLHPEFSETS